VTSPNGRVRAVEAEPDPGSDEFDDPSDTFFADCADQAILFPKTNRTLYLNQIASAKERWHVVDQVVAALERGPDADRFHLFSMYGREEMRRYPTDEAAYIDFVKLLLPYTGKDFLLIDEVVRRTPMSTLTWAYKDIGSGEYLSKYRNKVIILAAQEWYREFQAKAQTAPNGASNSAPPGTAPPPSTTYPEPEDMGVAVPSELAEVEYVANLLKPGRLLVVGAVEGSGKTYTISNELGIRFAWAGGDLAGTWSMRERGNVLLLSEMHRDDDIAYEERVLEALGGTRTNLSGRYFRLSLATAANGKPVLADLEWVNWLVDDFAPRHDIKLLILDTVASAIEGEPWGENIIGVFRVLKAIVEERPSLAIALITHMKKPSGGGEQAISDVMGQWTRFADAVLLMTPQDPGRVRLRTLKRLSPVDIIATQSGGLLVDPFPVTHTGKPKVDMGNVYHVIEQKPDLTVAELGDALGVSKPTAERYVAQGVKLGLLERHREGLSGPFRVRLTARTEP